MTASKPIESQNVLDHVKHAEIALANFHREGTRSDGVLRNPRVQTVALKVAMEELRKAVAILEHARWR
jgi:hypothetical protein